MTEQVPSYESLRRLAQSDPEQFRKLIEKVRSKVVYPHAAQQKVLDSTARFRVMNCGRRWGKTVLAAKIFVSKSRKKDQMLWWVAPTYKIVKRGYAEVLRQLPDGVLTHTPPPESNFDAGRSVILRFKNGTRMEFYSAERPEGMLGEGVDFAVLDEAATMPQRVWNQIVSPTLMDRLGGALMISTPRGRNWFYRAWLLGQDPHEEDWDSWTFPSDSNPTLPPGEVERMRKAIPRMEADQEIDAKFLAAGSSVFTLPDGCLQHGRVRNDYLIEGVPPAGFVVLGIDLARTNDWTVIYGARARDRRNCYFERMQAITWPEQKRRIRRAIRFLMRAGAEGVMLIMDSTGVGDPIVEDMEAEGFDVVGINFTTHKANMVKLLAKDLEERQAFILNDWITEFENYSMDTTPAGRLTYSAPEGEHDDIVSAKMLQHWGLVNEGVPEVQTISSDDTVQVVEDEREPWERIDEDGDYSDLIDDENTLTEADILADIGLEDPGHRRPSEQELMTRPDLWF